MDAPPVGPAGPSDVVGRFARIGAHLREAGLSAPETIAVDAAAGLLLAEDFGDDFFPALLGPTTAGILFDGAIDLLVAMQRWPAPGAPHAWGLPSWDGAAMIAATGASLYDWWWNAVFGEPAPLAARNDIDAALAAMLAPLDRAPRVFVHRDFFAGNLVLLPDREGVRRVGLIDYQDAALGHPAYDLVALIQDARRDVDAAIAERAVARYLAARPDVDPLAFANAMALCAAQRHLRVAAQWVRLDRRDAKPHYLAYGPRTWRLLQRALEHPACAPLAAALDRRIPAEHRANPPVRDQVAA
jgi:aminoglycoside/choline kinase family phosphotransferase